MLEAFCSGETACDVLNIITYTIWPKVCGHLYAGLPGTVIVGSTELSLHAEALQFPFTETKAQTCSKCAQIELHGDMVC